MQNQQQTQLNQPLSSLTKLTSTPSLWNAPGPLFYSFPNLQEVTEPSLTGQTSDYGFLDEPSFAGDDDEFNDRDSGFAPHESSQSQKSQIHNQPVSSDHLSQFEISSSQMQEARAGIKQQKLRKDMLQTKQIDLNSNVDGGQLEKREVQKKRKRTTKKSLITKGSQKRGNKPFRLSKQVLFDRLHREFKLKKTTEQCFQEKEIAEMNQYCTFRPALSNQLPNKNNSPPFSIQQHEKRTMSALGLEKCQKLYESAAKVAQKRSDMSKLSSLHEMKGCTFTPQVCSKRRAMSCDLGNISQSSIVSIPEAKRRKDQAFTRLQTSPVRSKCSVHERCRSGHLSQQPSDSQEKREKNSFFQKMVRQEVKSVLQSLSASQQKYGLSYEDFSQMMQEYQYASKQHEQLLFNIFHMVTGKVKPNHKPPSEAVSRTTYSGNNLQQPRMAITMMQMEDLKILIYSIRNVNDPQIFQNKVVFPEALNNNRLAVKENYKLKWRLSNSNHLRSFQQVLWPLSIFTATKKFNLRRTMALKLQKAKQAALGLGTRVKFQEAEKNTTQLKQSDLFCHHRPKIDVSNKFFYNNKNLSSMGKSENQDKISERFNNASQIFTAQTVQPSMLLSIYQKIRQEPLKNQKVLISVEPMSSQSSLSVEQDESAASKPRFETKRASISGLASLFGESTKNRFENAFQDKLARTQIEKSFHHQLLTTFDQVSPSARNCHDFDRKQKFEYELQSAEKQRPVTARNHKQNLSKQRDSNSLERDENVYLNEREDQSSQVSEIGTRKSVRRPSMMFSDSLNINQKTGYNRSHLLGADLVSQTDVSQSETVIVGTKFNKAIKSESPEVSETNLQRTK